jgi:hypothetical protein
MLNEILADFEKVREKDISTKNSIKSMIQGLKTDLTSLKSELEDIPNQMTVNF